MLNDPEAHATVHAWRDVDRAEQPEDRSAKSKELGQAAEELRRRFDHFDSIRVLPQGHPLRSYCRKKLEQAQAVYDKIVTEIDSIPSDTVGGDQSVGPED